MPNIAAEAHANIRSTIIKEFNGAGPPVDTARRRGHGDRCYYEVQAESKHPLRGAWLSVVQRRSPPDPYVGDLWSLHNTSQMVNGMKGMSGADIEAPTAWNRTKGSLEVIIVFDTGVDYRAPDLAPNIMGGMTLL